MSPLSFVVNAQGTATWDYSFDNSVDWDASVFDQSQYGTVNYHLRLSLTNKLLDTATDSDLV